MLFPLVFMSLLIYPLTFKCKKQIKKNPPDKTVILNTVKVNIFMNINMLLMSHFGVL